MSTRTISRRDLVRGTALGAIAMAAVPALAAEPSEEFEACLVKNQRV